MNDQSESRLAIVMTTLGLSAVELSNEIGVSNSLISRWQKGVRPLPTKGEATRKLVKLLAAADTEGDLNELLIPYNANDDKEQALYRYLTGDEMPGLAFTLTPVSVPYSGEYVAQQRVLLGVKGFRKATLLMLDYLALLPLGQELTICAHEGFDLWHGNLPFALQVLQKLSGILKRDTRITLITRDAEGFDGSPYFSVFWLSAQLKGIIRTQYYEGKAPREYFVASIKGYWSARVEHDETAEDDMISTLYTDARNIRDDEKHVTDFMERSTPAGQFAFLERPEGDSTSKREWSAGPLPTITDSKTTKPDGSFSVICRVPSFGIMTCEEWMDVRGTLSAPPLPDYLFNDGQAFAQAPYRIMLSKEDVQEGLLGNGGHNTPLSEVLGHKVSVSREILAAQLHRLLAAMDTNPDFELALMPRSAFEKLEIELIDWRDSASIGWLQDGTESLFTIDPLTCMGFDNAVNHVWKNLHKGWKRKKTVKATLRKWLAGEGLAEFEPDSASVRNWRVMPEE